MDKKANNQKKFQTKLEKTIKKWDNTNKLKQTTQKKSIIKKRGMNQ